MARRTSKEYELSETVMAQDRLILSLRRKIAELQLDLGHFKALAAPPNKSK